MRYADGGKLTFSEPAEIRRYLPLSFTAALMRRCTLCNMMLDALRDVDLHRAVGAVF